MSKLKKCYSVKNSNGETCGHKHKSIKTATKCLDNLQGWRTDSIGSQQICNAKWYKSKIVKN